MPINKLSPLMDTFGDPAERLDYLIDMIRQLQSMAVSDYPTVSRHLLAAHQEATRLSRLRS